MAHAKIDRLRKILALTTSEEDGEALLALRRAMKLLGEMGLDLEDFAREDIILAAQAKASVGEKPTCSGVIFEKEPGLLIKRAAPAEFFELPNSARADLEKITKRMTEVLNASVDSKSTRFTMKVQDGKGQVMAELDGYKPFEIWSGVSTDASKVIACLRRGYMHAFK